MGKLPKSKRAISRPIFSAVKSNYRKRLLTFGEFINAPQNTWSERQTGAMNHHEERIVLCYKASSRFTETSSVHPVVK
jgi:hypothetical protein